MDQLAVKIAIILFPGLIAAIIADKITLHSPKWGSFKYSIYSFIFGVFCYVLLSGLVWAIVSCPWLKALAPSLTGSLDVWSLITKSSIEINLKEVIAATLLSPVIAFLAAFSINFKIFNKAAEILQISRKYGDENLFSFYLNSDIDWVYVRDPERNLTYEGRVFSYSENEQIQELVLYDVKVYSYDDSSELYSIPTIYLSKPLGEFLIEAIPQERWMEADG